MWRALVAVVSLCLATSVLLLPSSPAPQSATARRFLSISTVDNGGAERVLSRSSLAGLGSSEQAWQIYERSDVVRRPYGAAPCLHFNPGRAEELLITLRSELLGKAASKAASTPSQIELVCLPSFMVLGAMKAGSTFLHDVLQQHPLVGPTKIKVRVHSRLAGSCLHAC